MDGGQCGDEFWRRGDGGSRSVCVEGCAEYFGRGMAGKEDEAARDWTVRAGLIGV